MTTATETKTIEQTKNIRALIQYVSFLQAGDPAADECDAVLLLTSAERDLYFLEQDLEPERLVQHATHLIKLEYMSDVKGIADSIKDDLADGTIETTDQLQERLHEDIDGSQRVIYTWQNKLGLLVSDNDDAYEQEGVELDPNNRLAQQMYWALLADVQEELKSQGVDLNEPFMCAKCETTYKRFSDLEGCCNEESDTEESIEA